MEVILSNGRLATYEVIGSGGEPLLTFVGGPGLAARLMRADAELFAERFTCYLIDPHGSGGSTPPQDQTAYVFVGHARFYEEVRRALGLGLVSVHGVSFGGSVALTYAALFPEVTTRCVAVSAFAVGEELDEEEGGDAAAEMEAALARHAHSAWYPEAREIWDNWTTRALAATDPGEVRDILGSVCKTMVRERLWYGTRRFDRQSMETFGATPAPKKASKGPSQRRSSAYHKRHALDRSHRLTLARPP